MLYTLALFPWLPHWNVIVGDQDFRWAPSSMPAMYKLLWACTQSHFKIVVHVCHAQWLRVVQPPAYWYFDNCWLAHCISTNSHFITYLDIEVFKRVFELQIKSCAQYPFQSSVVSNRHHSSYLRCWDIVFVVVRFPDVIKFIGLFLFTNDALRIRGMPHWYRLR